MGNLKLMPKLDLNSSQSILYKKRMQRRISNCKKTLGVQSSTVQKIDITRPDYKKAQEIIKDSEATPENKEIARTKMEEKRDH